MEETEAIPRNAFRKRRFRLLALASALLLVASFAYATGRIGRQRDVLKGADGSSGLGFNRCRVGVGHYAGIAPIEITTGDTIRLERVRVTAPPDSVDISARLAYYDRGYIGGFDGDVDFPLATSDVRFQELEGAEAGPGRVPFYIMLRVVARRPGPIVVESVHLDYSVNGRRATHTYRQSLEIDDYDAPPTEPECRGVPRIPSPPPG